MSFTTERSHFIERAIAVLFVVSAAGVWRSRFDCHDMAACYEPPAGHFQVVDLLYKPVVMMAPIVSNRALTTPAGAVA